jgi:hypothetical protein
VILAQGGRFAGWSLYMKDGRVSYVYNWFDKERYTITAPEALAAGKATIRYEFAYEGDTPGAGGKGTISVNGQPVAEGQIGNTVPFIFSADETADVGMDEATPVTEDYAEGDNDFTGKIEKVTVDLT